MLETVFESRVIAAALLGGCIVAAALIVRGLYRDLAEKRESELDTNQAAITELQANVTWLASQLDRIQGQGQRRELPPSYQAGSPERRGQRPAAQPDPRQWTATPQAGVDRRDMTGEVVPLPFVGSDAYSIARYMFDQLPEGLRFDDLHPQGKLPHETCFNYIRSWMAQRYGFIMEAAMVAAVQGVIIEWRTSTDI